MTAQRAVCIVNKNTRQKVKLCKFSLKYDRMPLYKVNDTGRNKAVNTRLLIIFET